MSGESRDAIFSFFYHIFLHTFMLWSQLKNKKLKFFFFFTKCSPFNLLSNGMFYVAIHAFVYELKCTSFEQPVSKNQIV